MDCDVRSSRPDATTTRHPETRRWNPEDGRVVRVRDLEKGDRTAIMLPSEVTWMVYRAATSAGRQPPNLAGWIYNHAQQDLANRGVPPSRSAPAGQLPVLECRGGFPDPEATDRMRGLFLARMSHEMRTPVNGIIGMADLLLGSDLRPEQKAYVRTLSDCADTLLDLVNDILDFAKIDAGKLDFEVVGFDLASVTGKVHAMVGHLAQEKGFPLTCRIAPNVPTRLRGDPKRLGQVLTNLAGNAVKFTESGRVTMDVSLVEESDALATLRFAVSDTGIGIPQDRMDELFQSFAQIHATASKRYGGTGLGLAISKQLVELMNGKIGAHSMIGKGSTFWFTVVLGKQPQQKEVGPEESVDLQELRVLVADDLPSSRRRLRRQLVAEGLRPEAATDGKRALQMMREAASQGSPFCMALVGATVRGPHGRLLSELIRCDPALRGTRLVIVTAAGPPGRQPAMHKLGVMACLRRPVTQAQLRACIAATGRAPRSMAASWPAGKRHRLPLRATGRAGTRILLAEDDATPAREVVDMLRSLGYAFDAVGNGKDALWALKRKEYDLVVLDFEMKEMDGIETARTIRNRASDVRNHEVPIIGIIPPGTNGEYQQCMDASMNACIPRPLRPQSLVTTIERQLLLTQPTLCLLPPLRPSAET